MDRAHRQELKHDKFVAQVGHTVEYAAEHKEQVIKWGSLALAALVIMVGFYGWTRYQASARADALREAIRLQDAQVGAQQSEFFAVFATDEEKRQAVQKKWSEIASSYSGSAEAAIAHYYMGINAADNGNMQEAEKHLKEAADSGKDAYASQAKLSLASVYDATGRQAEAEKILRSVIEDPTILVSKEQATIALARLLADHKPEEARKLLEPLRSEPGPASRAALTLLGEIPATAK